MVPALEVADIFRRHGEVFRQARAGHLGGIERRIMGAITACRTAVLGGHVEQCDDCGATRIAYNSCRNRHCPKCQGLTQAQWLADRQAELLPVPYFHVVFTLPAPIGEVAFQNKSVVYAILFRTAAETLATIAANPRHLGAKLGMTMVLHTWGQTLQHHPHVHCVVPGGGPSLESLVVPVSSYRCGCSRGCSAGCSCRSWRTPSRPASCGSSAILPALPNRKPSHVVSANSGTSTGWSTPSHHSVAPNRCWPISAAIPIALPSPTAGSSRSPTGRCASPGKTTDRAASPR